MTVPGIGLDGNGRNPFGNGNGSGGVRRTNSNPGRRRSRRASCPENSRGWGQMYHGPRNGYYGNMVLLKQNLFCLLACRTSQILFVENSF